MERCKYPNEVCANMTVLNGITYCDSTPCSLKNELPKQTNADRIRSMSDEELAEFLIRQQACDNCEYFGFGARCKAPNEFKCTNEYATAVVQKWLQSEVKGSE